MDHNVNPLSKYFRVPGISVKLPSNGRFQPVDNVTFSPLNDLQVYPMRGADEILMKSPDALMNGMAIIETIKSCIPGIKDPGALPNPDIDACLLAIRSSTYGDTMSIDCKCTHCQADNEVSFSIMDTLDSMTFMDEEYPLRLNDVINIHVKPFSFKTSTKLSNTAFEEAKKIQIAEDASVSEEEKQQVVNDSFRAISRMNTTALADCVQTVFTPEGIVDNPAHILEWLTKIEEEMTKINQAGLSRKKSAICNACSKEFETTIEFDPSNFFGSSS
jgi:hypothetical protein